MQTITDTTTATTFGNFSITPLAGFSFGSPLFTTSFTTGSQTIPVSSSVNFGPFTSSTMNATSLDTSNFAPYLGAGSFNIAVTTATFLALQGGNGNSGGTNVTNGSATAVVTYDFSPTSKTPEPTTMLLFGSGLVGLGLLRKRIKS